MIRSPGIPVNAEANLGNDGFATLVILVLAGVVIVSAAWAWFRS